MPASPAPSSAAASKVMKANRSKDTSPELAIRSALHRRGFRFFTHRRPLAGLRCTADIVFSRKRVCVFVDGCFWHGCSEHRRIPRANADYWVPKIQRNIERDRRNDEALRAAGWTVVRVWEHEDVSEAVARVTEAVERAGSPA